MQLSSRKRLIARNQTTSKHQNGKMADRKTIDETPARETRDFLHLSAEIKNKNWEYNIGK